MARISCIAIPSPRQAKSARARNRNVRTLTFVGISRGEAGPVRVGAQVDQGQTYVTVYNPWGIDGKAWDSNSADGLLTLSIDDVQSQFMAFVVCTA